MSTHCLVVEPRWQETGELGMGGGVGGMVGSCGEHEHAASPFAPSGVTSNISVTAGMPRRAGRGSGHLGAVATASVLVAESIQMAGRGDYMHWRRGCPLARRTPVPSDSALGVVVCPCEGAGRWALGRCEHGRESLRAVYANRSSCVVVCCRERREYRESWIVIMRAICLRWLCVGRTTWSV